MPMAGFQILSIAILFKRGCLPWKGDIKNHYCHILRFKTRSSVYYSGKQLHPMLRNHINFLGIEDINHGKATRFFSCGKKPPTQRTPTTDLNPVCHMHYGLSYTICEHFCYFFYETTEKNPTTDPRSWKRYNLKSTQHFINCYGLTAYQISATAFWFLNAVLQSLLQVCSCLLELKNQGTTCKTEKLTGFPSDQERWHINPIKIFPLQNLEQR